MLLGWEEGHPSVDPLHFFISRSRCLWYFGLPAGRHWIRLLRNDVNGCHVTGAALAGTWQSRVLGFDRHVTCWSVAGPGQ